MTKVPVTQLELFKPSQILDLTVCKTKFTFIDLFAGIGGFRIPLQQLGGKCLGYSEIDKEAKSVYCQNFLNCLTEEESYLGDITNIKKLPLNIDLLVGGVPCQPWSIAGKLKGFNDNRGQLWFDVIRLVKQSKPKAFIFENVKGLTEPRNKQQLNYIINHLTNAGYVVKHSVLNSYDFGIPQDRDRVFIIGIKKDISNASSFQFPKPLPKKIKLYDVIEGIKKQPIEKKKFAPEILFGKRIPASRGRFQKIDELNDFFTFADIRDGHTTIHSWDLIKTSQAEKIICKAILKNRRKKIYGLKDGNPLNIHILKDLIPNLKEEDLESLVDKKILRFIPKQGYEFVNSKISSGINGVAKIFLPHSDVISTLTATGTRDFIATESLECQDPIKYKKAFINKIYRRKKFKPLSSKDYAKLQGFPDWFTLHSIEKIAKKQFGNAVSVPVVYHLAQSVLKVIL
jgi:DNA (cytosine-5)-methyltransferase 1